MYVEIYTHTTFRVTGYNCRRQVRGVDWYLTSWGEWVRSPPLYAMFPLYELAICKLKRYPFVRPYTVLVPHIRHGCRVEAKFDNQTRGLSKYGWMSCTGFPTPVFWFSDMETAKRAYEEYGLPAYDHQGFVACT